MFTRIKTEFNADVVEKVNQVWMWNPTRPQPPQDPQTSKTTGPPDTSWTTSRHSTIKTTGTRWQLWNLLNHLTHYNHLNHRNQVNHLSHLNHLIVSACRFTGIKSELSSKVVEKVNVVWMWNQPNFYHLNTLNRLNHVKLLNHLIMFASIKVSETPTWFLKATLVWM